VKYLFQAFTGYLDASALVGRRIKVYWLFVIGVTEGREVVELLVVGLLRGDGVEGRVGQRLNFDFIRPVHLGNPSSAETRR
jgi:hypothetical protein